MFSLFFSPTSAAPQELTGEYGVTSMPTFIFFKKGQKVESFSGASEAKLKELIAKLQ